MGPMLVLRSLVFNVAFYVVLIGIMICALPVLAMRPAAVRGAARAWGRASLWLLRVICGTTVEFRGLENIPAGPVLVAAKHQSVWEVFSLILAFPNFTYVLKRELTFIPLFGWYLSRSRQIAIDRTKGRAALTQVVRQGRVVIGEGRQLFIFPEGTRRPPGAPPDYKYGVAFVYGDLGVPCVPVALASGLFWPRRSFIRRPGTVVVDILPPIAPGLPGNVFLPQLQDAIETATDRLIAEATRRDPTLKEMLRPAEA